VFASREVALIPIVMVWFEFYGTAGPGHVEKTEESKIQRARHVTFTSTTSRRRYCREFVPIRRLGKLEITRRECGLSSHSVQLHVERLGRGYAWLDNRHTRQPHELTDFVRVAREAQGFRMACPERWLPHGVHRYAKNLVLLGRGTSRI